MEEKQTWWSSYLTVSRSCARKQSIQKILGEEYIWLYLNGKTSNSGNPLGKINKVLSSIGLRDCKQLSKKKSKFLVSPEVFVPSLRSKSSPFFSRRSRGYILLAFCRVLSNSVSEKIAVDATINELAGS